MAINAGSVYSELILRADKFFATLKKAGEKMDGFAKDLKAKGKKMESTGKELTKKVSLPLIAIGTAGIAAAEDIKKATNTIAYTTGKTGEELASLETAFENTFREATTSASVVAEVTI